MKDFTLAELFRSGVTVRAERDGVYVAVSMADEDRGFSAELLPQPFRKFSRASGAATASSIDYARRWVTLAGEPVELTTTGYALLYELSVHAPMVLTPSVLLQRVRRSEKVSEAWLVRDVVERTRRKLGDSAGSPRYILTEPRVGYRMAKGRSLGERT